MPISPTASSRWPPPAPPTPRRTASGPPPHRLHAQTTTARPRPSQDPLRLRPAIHIAGNDHARVAVERQRRGIRPQAAHRQLRGSQPLPAGVAGLLGSLRRMRRRLRPLRDPLPGPRSTVGKACACGERVQRCRLRHAVQRSSCTYVPAPVAGRRHITDQESPGQQAWRRHHPLFPRVLFVLDGTSPAGLDNRALHALTGDWTVSAFLRDVPVMAAPLADLRRH